LIQSVL